MKQIPFTADLLTTSGMQLAMLVQPLALPHPSEEPIQVLMISFFEVSASGVIFCLSASHRCFLYLCFFFFKEVRTLLYLSQMFDGLLATCDTSVWGKVAY